MSVDQPQSVHRYGAPAGQNQNCEVKHMSKILTTEKSASPHRLPSGPLTADRRNPREKYLLGIDGGGTKTHAVVTDSSCNILGEGFSGAANPLRAGLED